MYSTSETAIKARRAIALRVDINRITEQLKFWQGESLRDWGFTLESSEESYNSSPRTLYATREDGARFLYDPCFHSWRPAQ